MYKRQNVENKGRRVVNFRPLFYGFLAFAVGIGLSYYIFSLNWVYIAILACGFFAIFLFAFFRKQFINFIVIISCFACGIGAYFIDFSVCTSEKYNGEICEVVGKVTTRIYEYDNYTYAILDDVTINGSSSKNLSVNISIYDSFKVESGMKLKFSAEIYDEFLFENGEFNSFSYRNNCFHNAVVSSEDIVVLSENNFSFAENVRLFVKDLIYSFMPEQTAELSYSILFGDQVKLDTEIKEAFATSGLGHLVAVSGLNTAVLVACLYWLLKRFRCTGWPRFIIVAVILIFYCYLCSFTPSVVRASVMSLTFLALQLFGRQYDLLSSLGVSGFIILLFSPFSVFDVGFQLSFVSVIGIALLLTPLSKFFTNKCRIPKKISEAIAIDFSTTISIAPILAIYFGKISIFSFIANLICVPLFSLAYIFVFALVLLCSALKFLGFMFFVPDILLSFVIWFSGVIASIQWAIIMLYSLSIIGAVAFYIILFFVSKMYLGSLYSRFIVINLSLIIAILGSLIPISTHPNSYSYTQLNTLSPNLVVTARNGEVLALGNNVSELSKYLSYHHINYVTTYLYTSKNEDNRNFVLKYNVQNVMNYSSGLKQVGSFGVMFIEQDGKNKAIYLKVDNVGILVGFDLIGSTQAKNISKLIGENDLSIIYEARKTLHFTQVKDTEYVFSNYKIDCSGNYATKINSGFTFDINNGIIGNIRGIN